MAVALHSENIEIQEEDGDDEEEEEDDDIINANVETKTTVQQKHPQKLHSVRKRYRLVGLGLGLLGVVQALLNIGLRLSLYSDLTKENNNLTKYLDHLQSISNNITEHNDELKYRYDNLTKHNDELQSIYDKQKYQYGLDLDHLQSRFDHLQSRYNELIKRDDNKRILCESNRFTFGDGLCYYISTEKKTWEQSRQYCRDRQSDLIVIKSNDQKDLVNKVNKNKESMWLGLTDREVEGVWKWVDETPLTTPTYWSEDEPNNYPGEDCVEVYNGRWNDKSCSFQNHWLCERVI